MMIKIDQCPACGDSNPLLAATMDKVKKARYLQYSQVKYSGLLNDWFNEFELTIDSCSKCGHHWYREQPSEDMLSEMYEAGRPLSGIVIEPDRSASKKMIKEMSRLLRIIDKPAARLLDYGSGYGRWSRAAVSAGFIVTAYEPSLERGSEKEATNFISVHDANDLKEQKFDVINIEQVLEHVPNPVNFLKDIHKYCTSETILRITVPNLLRCPEGAQIWHDWPYDGVRTHTMAPFEHLQGFTPLSLLITVKNAGFMPLKDFSTWLRYPAAMIRDIIGKLIPQLGQTFILVKVSENVEKD
jgi:2-polyprenyl-3-methyl-5-hydroxy-6-metoxy-1,4-benzoquinol methylase